MGIAVYQGPFGRRASGAPALARRLRPAARRSRGAREARARRRRPLADPARRREVRRARRPATTRAARSRPADAWGHDHLWWLDRMVRTSRPLVERMTLVWHDWFATSLDGVGSQKLMLKQNKLLRRLSLGSFDSMLREITKDPAMLLWLSGHGEHEVVAERELRPRADGALHARRGPRLHRARRARAGPRPDRLRQRLEARPRPRQLPLRRQAPRPGAEARLRQDGRLRLAGRRPALPPPPASTPPSSSTSSGATSSRRRPDAATRRSLESLYRKDFQIRPVVEAILLHPALHTGPRMVKPPAVYTAGLLRALGRGVDTQAWVVALDGSPASGSSCRRTSPAGTTSAGSTRRPSAAAGRSRTTPAARTR